MATGQKTLWIWSTLPKQGVVAQDQSWRKEGDSVENVGRIQMGELGDQDLKTSVWVLSSNRLTDI